MSAHPELDKFISTPPGTRYHWTYGEAEWLKVYEGMLMPSREAFVPWGQEIEDSALDTDRDFPFSDVLDELTEEMWAKLTHSEQVDAAILDGLPMMEYLIQEAIDEENEQQAEHEAEARMGGDNHYYEESYEEAEMRFAESLPPAGVDPELFHEANRNYAQFPTPQYDEYISKLGKLNDNEYYANFDKEQF